jgi:hypothetical protein
VLWIIPPKSSPYPLHAVVLCLGLTLASQLPPRGRRGEVWVEWHVRRPCYARWPPPRQQPYSQVLYNCLLGNLWIAGLCKRGIFLLATMPPAARVVYEESSDMCCITVQLGRLCQDSCCQHCTQTAFRLSNARKSVSQPLILMLTLLLGFPCHSLPAQVPMLHQPAAAATPPQLAPGPQHNTPPSPRTPH